MSKRKFSAISYDNSQNIERVREELKEYGLIDNNVSMTFFENSDVEVAVIETKPCKNLFKMFQRMESDIEQMRCANQEMKRSNQEMKRENQALRAEMKHQREVDIASAKSRLYYVACLERLDLRSIPMTEVQKTLVNQYAHHISRHKIRNVIRYMDEFDEDDYTQDEMVEMRRVFTLYLEQ